MLWRKFCSRIILIDKKLFIAAKEGAKSTGEELLPILSWCLMAPVRQTPAQLFDRMRYRCSTIKNREKLELITLNILGLLKLAAMQCSNRLFPFKH